MATNPFIHITTNTSGLYQLCGRPGTNYEFYLYEKAIVTRRKGHRIIWIDNQQHFNVTRLKKDLKSKPEDLEEFFVFSPDDLTHFLDTVDDLDLHYLTNKPVIFVDNIFEHLVTSPRDNKKLRSLAWIMGQLSTLSNQHQLPIFITNELRKSKDYPRPFLAHLLPRFFTKVYIMDYIGRKTSFHEYNLI